MANISVRSDVALDMSRNNALLDFAKGLLLSGGKPKFAFSPPNGATLILSPDKNGLSDAIGLSGSGFGLGTVKLPGGKEFFGPTKGTITSIDVWEYNHKTKMYGDMSKASLYNMKLDLGNVYSTLLKFNPLRQPNDLAKAANSLYEQLLGGSDWINGSNKDDTLKSFKGADIVYGNGGKDAIFGGDGNDKLYGGAGQDTLRGEAGNDWLFGGVCANVKVNGKTKYVGDVLEGGGLGSDWAAYGDATKGITADLRNSVQPNKGAKVANKGEFAAGDTYGSIENLAGSRYDDKLYGDGKSNILLGDAGRDQLTGNGAADMFVFSDMFGDKVLDFHGGDTIGLNEDLFKGIGNAAKGDNGHKVMNAGAFRVNKTGFAEDKDDRVIFNSDKGELLYDADGVGGSGPYLIAQLWENEDKLVKSLSLTKVQVIDMDFLTL